MSVGGAWYESSIHVSVLRQADYVHQAFSCPLGHIINPLALLSALSFRSQDEAHRTALISIFVGRRPDTSLHCKTTDIGLMHRAMCLFMPQLLLVLIVPTQGVTARLSCPGWLATWWDGLPTYRWSPNQVLTIPTLISFVNATNDVAD